MRNTELLLPAWMAGIYAMPLPAKPFATIVIPEKEKESIRVDFNLYLAEMEEVWKVTEPGLKMELESADLPDRTLTAESTTRLLNALYACPHGVFP